MKKIALVAVALCAAAFSFASLSGTATTIAPAPPHSAVVWGTLDHSLKPLQSDVGSGGPWSAGLVAHIGVHNKKIGITTEAAIFNDFHPLTSHGQATRVSWAGFVGTSVESASHPSIGAGLHFDVPTKWDQIRGGFFLGADTELGGPSGIAAGANISVKF